MCVCFNSSLLKKLKCIYAQSKFYIITKENKNRVTEEDINQGTCSVLTKEWNEILAPLACRRPVLSDRESSKPRGLGKTRRHRPGSLSLTCNPKDKRRIEKWSPFWWSYFLLDFMTSEMILHRCPVLFVKYRYSHSFSAPPTYSRDVKTVPNHIRNLFKLCSEFTYEETWALPRPDVPSTKHPKGTS